jgi:hypothetical protein
MSPTPDEELRMALEALARVARVALEAASPNQLGVGFERFPKGTCGPVSELMGRIVLERTGLRGVYVCGSAHPLLRSGQSHAWLEVAGFIVDVTYDQFPDTGVAGYVLKNSAWHSQFEREETALCLDPSSWGQYPHRAYVLMKSACDRVQWETRND